MVGCEEREVFVGALAARLRDLYPAGTDQKERICRCSLSNNQLASLKIHLPNRDGSQCIRAHIGKKTITEECVIHGLNRKNQNQSRLEPGALCLITKIYKSRRPFHIFRSRYAWQYRLYRAKSAAFEQPRSVLVPTGLLNPAINRFAGYCPARATDRADVGLLPPQSSHPHESRRA